MSYICTSFFQLDLQFFHQVKSCKESFYLLDLYYIHLFNCYNSDIYKDACLQNTELSLSKLFFIIISISYSVPLVCLCNLEVVIFFKVCIIN